LAGDQWLTSMGRARHIELRKSSARPVRRNGQRIGAARRDQNGITSRDRLRVRHVVVVRALVPLAGYDGCLRSAPHGDRRDELRRVCHLRVDASLDQYPAQLCRLS
jgi:hypothetical protein